MLRRRPSPPPAGASWCYDPEAFGPPVPEPRKPAALVAARHLGGQLSRAWTRSPWGRLAGVVVAVSIAYHYSLMTLIRSLGLDTPLAYLGLVPAIALGLVALRTQPAAGEPDIVDRQLDFIIGLPLLAAAIAIVTLLPGKMSTLFWYDRIDLLSVPLFAGGVIALTLGVRPLWRVRFALLFLLLAWPVPYLYALDKGMSRFTGLTLGALHALVRQLPVATPMPGGDGSEFLLGHGARAFEVSVASACTGVDSFVGFLLVGVAFLSMVRGRRLAKIAWLLVGLSLVYTLNLGRLMLIFWAASSVGQSFAIDGLHPVIGLFLFCLGIGVMVAALPLFRLRTRSPEPSQARDRAAPRRRRPAVAPGWLATTGLRAATAIVAVATLVLGVANAGLSRYTLVASDLGQPRLSAFLVSPAQLDGWAVDRIASYDWTQRFFGSGSSWIRYQYTPTRAGQPTSVIADVVTTSDLGAFNAYGIEACYRFHGYGTTADRQYALGGGVAGHLLTFRDPTLPEDWNALYWVWAVKTPAGTRYERVVLLAPVAGPYLEAAGRSADHPAAFTMAGASTGVSPATRSASRAFLVTFARDLIRSRATAAGTSPTATAGAAAPLSGR